MRQIYNHAQDIHQNSHVTHEDVPTIGFVLKKLGALLPDKEVLIDGLILTPLFIGLMIVMLSL